MKDPNLPPGCTQADVDGPQPDDDNDDSDQEPELSRKGPYGPFSPLGK